ncbi:hypothetical protein CQW49_11935 [Methylosinus trichosporium OB3b]|uniref:HTH HARE-type domain-containing protein n=2 Tax=Methylocystaceae TaxID=31993 RepID=A0A2D2D0K1_METT3|nr:hypothetical protein CQW49_11935 [Methylosinus trichosporium OB3b]
MAEFEDLLARLRRQRENAADVVHRLDSAINLLEEAKRVLGPEDLLNFMDHVSTPTTLMIGSKRSRGVLPPEDVALAVKKILMDFGKPMKRGELVEELERRGIPLAGRDKNKNLGTIIWRHPQHFLTLSGLGYWVRGVPLEGVYTPEE